MVEQGKLRDAHLRAQEQPLAWAAWEIKHHSRQHNVRSWSIQALRAGGYVVDGAARRVRGGDGLPGGWITPLVLTQKGEKLASTWSAAKSKALEAKWAKAKKAFEQSLEAAAHARSIRSAMGDEALAFARAEQAAEPGAFWDEVVRVLKKSAGQPERHENPARTVLPRKGPWYAGHAKKIDVFDAAYVGKGNDALGPGFYFASDVKTARAYGEVVHQVEISWKKTIDPYKPTPARLFQAFMDAVPTEQWEVENDTNWGEPTAWQARMKIERSLRGLSLLELLDLLPGTVLWYGDHPRRILNVIVRAGYTGFVVPAGSHVKERTSLPEEWAVVWDASAIRQASG